MNNRAFFFVVAVVVGFCFVFCLLFFLLQIPCLNFCVILEMEGRELTVRAQRTAYSRSNLNSNDIFYFLKVFKIQHNYRCESVKTIVGL